MWRRLMVAWLVSVLANAELISDDPEQNMNAIELISHWGYNGEQHYVKTVDGWTLELQRIPYGRNESASTPGKPVVILQHGVECASDNWLLNLPEESAGFVFADAGFDVWLPNSRMNTYASLENYTPDDSEFWRFTNDDMIRHDLDAVFDYIENATGESQFYYIGHSQGNVNMFGKLAQEPEFAQRLRQFFALGPAVSFVHLKGPFRYLCKTEPGGVDVWNALAWTRFGLELFQQSFINLIAQLTCSVGLEQDYCATLFYWIGGDSTTTNVTRMPVYLTHIPAGVSTALVQHYCQALVNGGFPYYDYPTEAENIQHYGSTAVPSYNISRIRDVDIYLYSSPDDYLTTEQDLNETFYKYINNSLVKGHYSFPGFSHMDFIWGLNATEMVYKPIIELINENLQKSD